MAETGRQKRKLAAVLSIDVVGYSRLMQDDEEATLETLRRYRAAIDRLAQQHDGRIVNAPGDNILAEFPSAVEAVRAAVDIQDGVETRNRELPDHRRMRLRIGANLGDVLVEPDGTLYGDGVNIAARMESLADAGGIVVSAKVHDEVKGRVPSGFESLGAQTVKNIEEPVLAFRVGPQGAAAEVTQAEPRRPYRLAAAALIVLAIAGIATWLITRPPEPDTVADAAQSPEIASLDRMAFPLPDEPSIAVLPFDNLSGNAEHDSIADGLSENIIAVLSQARGMLVIARSSTFTYKGKPVKTQQVAEELGVRYVLEGSVQVSEQSLRVTAQLIDALTGSHIWSERFDRALSDVFAVQDEITLEVVTALQVELTEGPQAVVWRGGTDSLEAWTHYLRGLVLLRRFTKEDNLRARSFFEKAVAIDHEFALGWVYVGHSLSNAVRYGWSDDPEADWRRVEEVGRQALDIDSEYPDTYVLLAIHAALHGDAEQSIALARKSVEFGPGNSVVAAIASAQFMWAGQLDEALALMRRAMRLSPHYPAWYALFLARIQNSLGNYEESIPLAEQAIARMPASITWGHPELMHGLARVGRLDEAKSVLEEALERDPQFSIQAHRERQQRCCPWTAALMDERESALRLAGVPERPPSAVTDRPSIAVLPFINLSGDPEQEYFSDGMTEDIITSFSRFRELSVIARSTSFQYKGQAVAVEKLGEELGVRYVLEGSIRKIAESIRVTTQLSDSRTGRPLWAETFDRKLSATNIFAVQDEITNEVVNTIGDTYGVLSRIRLDEARVNGTDSMEAYECVLRAHEYYRNSFTPKTHLTTRECLEHAVELDPNYADAWAWLAAMYRDEYSNRFNTQPDPIIRAIETAQHALTLDSMNQEAHIVLAHMLFFRGELEAFFVAAERAIAVNPNSFDLLSSMGLYIAFAGEYERGVELFRNASALNPHPPGWFYVPFFLDHFRKGEYEEALAEAQKIDMPGYFLSHVARGAAYGKLGREQEAESAAASLLELYPDFLVGARELIGRRVKSAELVEDLIDGLRKSGLDIRDEPNTFD